MTKEEIMRECLGEEFFDGNDETTIEKAIAKEDVIEVESLVVIPEEVKAIEAPKEIPPKEESSGIDFAKRTEGSKDIPKEEAPKEEAPKEEVLEKVTHQADIKMTTTIVDSKTGETDDKEEILASVSFPDVPAKVFFKKGLTRNLGNFESYRVDVGIEMPCSSENLKKYVLEGGKVVEHRLALEIQKAQRLYGSAGGSVFDRVNVNL